MRIQLFGSPVILVGDRRFAHRSRKAMALLAYLAMRADEHVSRAHLAALLWSDSGEEQARANLRQTLSQLRKLFRDAGRDPIMVPFDQVVLHSEAIEIDARQLLNAPSDISLQGLETQPAFLEGFTLCAPEFETWMTSQRNKIRSRLSELLKTAADRACTQGQYATAAEHLSLALTIDPLQEAAHRSLMQALNALGRTDAALSQFEACRKILARELQSNRTPRRESWRRKYGRKDGSRHPRRKTPTRFSAIPAPVRPWCSRGKRDCRDPRGIGRANFPMRGAPCRRPWNKPGGRATPGRRSLPWCRIPARGLRTARPPRC